MLCAFSHDSIRMEAGLELMSYLSMANRNLNYKGTPQVLPVIHISPGLPWEPCGNLNLKMGIG